MSDYNKPLSRSERLILMNQYEILELISQLQPNFTRNGKKLYLEPSTYRRYQQVIESGYELLIDELWGDICQPRLSRDAQGEVLDILDMYNDLQWSLEQLDDKEGLSEEDVKFPGWDGNSTQGELYFAMLYCFRSGEDFPDPLTTTPDRYENVKPSPAYNGHGPWLEGYKRMLKVFSPLKNHLLSTEWRPLAASEIKSIIEEFPHPDSPRGQEIRNARQI